VTHSPWHFRRHLAPRQFALLGITDFLSVVRIRNVFGSFEQLIINAMHRISCDISGTCDYSTGLISRWLFFRQRVLVNMLVGQLCLLVEAIHRLELSFVDLRSRMELFIV
jgi:hypothetical protein